MKTKQFHILKIINVIILIILITGCSSEFQTLKLGEYASSIPSYTTKMYYRYILGYKVYTKGDTLAIYENNSFKYSTCGGEKFGKYIIKKDTLFLNVDSTFQFYKEKIYNTKYTDTLYIVNEDYIEYKFRAKLTKESKNSVKAISRFFYINK